MKLWLARDKNGDLYLYDTKPHRDIDTFHSFGPYGEIYLWDDDMFPEVIFENSPQEVEIKLASTGLDRGKRNSIIRGLKQLEHDYMLSYEEEIDWLNKLVEE